MSSFGCHRFYCLLIRLHHFAVLWPANICADHMIISCLSGPLLAFPVQNVGVSVTSLSLGSVTSLTLLSACIAEGVVKALREACSQVTSIDNLNYFHNNCTQATIKSSFSFEINFEGINFGYFRMSKIAKKLYPQKLAALLV